MRTITNFVLTLTLALSCVVAHAADPTNIAELKEHFSAYNNADIQFSADYTMAMDMAEAGQPQAAGMGTMTMGGDMKVKGDVARMTMSMSMPAGDQTMEMKVDMHMDGTMMTMMMDMGGNSQAMKMDLEVMAELADDLGVPESALNSGNMGMGAMANPAKMLEQYEEMYNLALDGKETLNGEEVYVITAQIKEDVLENFAQNPMLQMQVDMFKNASKLYLGANDGIMRKMTMGDFMSMTLSNLDFETPVTDADLALPIPEGMQVMDMTQMMKGMFGGQN